MTSQVRKHAKKKKERKKERKKKKETGYSLEQLASSFHQVRIIRKGLDFPEGPVVKNPPANAEDMGSIPGPGRCHMPSGN